MSHVPLYDAADGEPVRLIGPLLHGVVQVQTEDGSLRTIPINQVTPNAPDVEGLAPGTVDLANLELLRRTLIMFIRNNCDTTETVNLIGQAITRMRTTP